MVGILKKEKIIILLILLVSFLIRIWNVGNYPVSLSMDEASIGYNAYSILKIGKDEWGQKFPLAFKSVGDYKPPVDIYLTVPFVAVFGLTELSVRLPVVLFGTFSVLIFILLLKQLNLSKQGYLSGGIWLGISPWFVNFSRSSYEAVTALFFLLVGVLAIVLWSKNRSFKCFILSISSFALSVWTYHAERLFVPLLLVFLIIIFKQSFIELSKEPKKLLLTLLVLLFFIIPFANLTIFTDAIQTRAASTSILRETNLSQNLHNGAYKSDMEYIFDNDIYLIFRHWAGKYLNYYDLRFWFWKGLAFTPPGYPDVGLLYVIDIPIFILGLYKLIRSKNKLLKQLSVFWFFTGPIPASLTMNEQHALRALIWLPFFGIIMALGYELFFQNFKHHMKRSIFYLFLLLVNIFYFADIYFNQFPRFYSEYISYGYKQIAQYSCEHLDEYKNILITDTYGSEGPLNTGTPYIYILFHCKYDPAKFIADDRKIDKFAFRRINWKHDVSFRNMKDSLLVASPWDLDLNEIPEEKIVNRINFLNGKLGFIFIRP